MAASSEHPQTYWSQSRGPLASLVLIAPLLIVYESGAVFFGVRNGADEFMRQLLNLLGFSQHFLLPVLTVCILLAWHYLSHEPWHLSAGVISTMVAECLVLGVVLRFLGFVQRALLTLSLGDSITQCIGFLGAGIYEELLFRLILLSTLAWALRRAGSTPRASTIVAVVVSSLLFALTHHIGPGGEPLRWHPFLFRSLAGAYFSVLFAYRGFGIAAGAHAAYDIFVWLVG